MSSSEHPRQTAGKLEHIPKTCTTAPVVISTSRDGIHGDDGDPLRNQKSRAWQE